MLATFLAWRRQTRHEFTEVGVEVEVDDVLEPAGDGPAVRVRGRIDRLERDAAGRLVVIDVKTGKSPVSKDDAQHHAQLALYQLAVAGGRSPQIGEPGGGRLVYPAKPSGDGATERAQDALTPQTEIQWREQVTRAAAATAGPLFTARVNDGCSHCPLRPSCPARERI
jgi:RecB family exonuclease